MATHRQADRQALMPELARFAQRLIELAAAAQIALGKVVLYGGIQKDDFGDEEKNPNAQAELDEAMAAMSAAQEVLKAMEKETPGYPGLTIKHALLRVAKG